MGMQVSPGLLEKYDLLCRFLFRKTLVKLLYEHR